MSTQTRICGNCGQQNRVIHSEQVCCGCKQTSFSMTDPDDGVAKHFVPSHYFERGDYEVWAKKSFDGAGPIVLIADGLSLKTAMSYTWPFQEIRRNGKQVSLSQALSHRRP